MDYTELINRRLIILQNTRHILAGYTEPRAYFCQREIAARVEPAYFSAACFAPDAKPFSRRVFINRLGEFYCFHIVDYTRFCLFVNSK
jgi:hypothetical protein